MQNRTCRACGARYALLDGDHLPLDSLQVVLCPDCQKAVEEEYKEGKEQDGLRWQKRELL